MSHRLIHKTRPSFQPCSSEFRRFFTRLKCIILSRNLRRPSTRRPRATNDITDEWVTHAFVERRVANSNLPSTFIPNRGRQFAFKLCSYLTTPLGTARSPITDKWTGWWNAFTDSLKIYSQLQASHSARIIVYLQWGAILVMYFGVRHCQQSIEGQEYTLLVDHLSLHLPYNRSWHKHFPGIGNWTTSYSPL